MKKYQIHQIFSKSFLKFSLFLFLSLFLSNCGKPGRCIEQEDVGGISFYIDAQNDGNFIINQGYINSTGGQRAAWFDTGYKTNGDSFHIEISGEWMAWFGDETPESKDNIFPSYGGKDICNIQTENKGSEALDLTGEFDFITNTHVMLPNKQKIALKPSEQTPCWLNQGEGLYIGFFGQDGFEMPEVAHHLKIKNATDIRCQIKYQHDLDKDGKISFNECYEDMCGQNYQHDDNNNGIIEPNECYDTNKKDYSYKINRSIAVYKIPNFMKRINGEMISKNEVVKLVILDKYYSDNIGAYKVTFYRGIGTRDKGLFEKIIEEIENIFLGEINPSTQKREKGVIYTIYNKIILNTVFSNLIRIVATLYIAFFGFGILTGSISVNNKEIISRIFKLSFVLILTSPAGWEIFNKYIMGFFFDGMGAVNAIIKNIADSSLGSAVSSSLPSTKYAFSNASNFSFIDDTFLTLLNPFSSTSVITRISGLVFGVWYGILIAIALYVLIFFYLKALVTMTFPYIISLVQVTLVLSLSPIFISFYLFEKTQHMFKSWLVFISARFFEMSILFIFLYMMNSTIMGRIMKLLDFKACYLPLKEILKKHGATAPAIAFFVDILSLNFAFLFTDMYKGILEYFVDIFVIFISILIFKFLAEKLTDVSNSLFNVWGESHTAKTGYGKGGLVDYKGFLPTLPQKWAKGMGKKYITQPLKKKGGEVGRSVLSTVQKRAEDITGITKLKKDSKLRELKAKSLKEAETKGLRGPEARKHVLDTIKKTGEYDKFTDSERGRILGKTIARASRGTLYDSKNPWLNMAIPRQMRNIRAFNWGELSKFKFGYKQTNLSTNQFIDQIQKGMGRRVGAISRRQVEDAIKRDGKLMTKLEANDNRIRQENLDKILASEDKMDTLNKLINTASALEKETKLTDEEKQNISLMENILDAPDLLKNKESLLELTEQSKKEIAEKTNAEKTIEELKRVQEKIEKQQAKIKEYQIAILNKEIDSIINSSDTDTSQLNKLQNQLSILQP